MTQLLHDTWGLTARWLIHLRKDRMTLSLGIVQPLILLTLVGPLLDHVVQDTGEGIPPEYQNKIFEKFGQVESRKAGLKMSTGLGLTLCRYVVKAHGGDIWVESQLGQGSRFKFTIPCKR